MAALWYELDRRGLRVEVRGSGRTLAIVPPGQLTEDELAVLRQQKGAVIEHAQEMERRYLVSRIAKAFVTDCPEVSVRNDTTIFRVEGVFAGTLPEWSDWLEMAPLVRVREALQVIHEVQAHRRDPHVSGGPRKVR